MIFPSVMFYGGNNFLSITKINVMFHVLYLNRPDEVITPKDDPIVQEISDVLREWSSVWKRLYAVSSSIRKKLIHLMHSL